MYCVFIHIVAECFNYSSRDNETLWEGRNGVVVDNGILEIFEIYKGDHSLDRKYKTNILGMPLTRKSNTSRDYRGDNKTKRLKF